MNALNKKKPNIKNVNNFLYLNVDKWIKKIDKYKKFEKILNIKFELKYWRVVENKPIIINIGIIFFLALK